MRVDASLQASNQALIRPRVSTQHDFEDSVLQPSRAHERTLRMRVPRQLGYKSVKYITRLTATDSLKGFGKGLGSAAPEGGYAWYAGI